MAELKTHKTNQSVNEFLASVSDDARRLDAQALSQLMQDITGCEPAMWGSSIVGFDEYAYKYGSGHTGTWVLVGFSPRKANLTIYITDGFESYHQLLDKLGPHTLGKSCLYIKRLGDVDIDVLRELITRSVQHMRETFPRPKS